MKLKNKVEFHESKSNTQSENSNKHCEITGREDSRKLKLQKVKADKVKVKVDKVKVKAHKVKVKVL